MEKKIPPIKFWDSRHSQLSRHAVFDGAQKAEARSRCTGDFLWQMDADEVVHENENQYDKNFDYSSNDTLFFIQKGHSAKLRQGKGNFGRVYALMREGNEWVAVSDPDWQGSSGAVK